MKYTNITKQNVKGFFQGNIRLLRDKINLLPLPLHIKEQIEYAVEQTSIKSPECISSGSCIHCGCTTPNKMYEDRSCEHGCYPAKMNQEDWTKFKYKNQIHK